LFEIQGRQLPGIYIDDVFHKVQGPEHIVRCRHCGLVYVNPRVILSPAMTTYTREQENAYFAATKADRTASNAVLLSHLAHLVEDPTRLLDIGFGDGLLLQQAQQRGWSLWGVEVSANLVNRLAPHLNEAQLYHGTLTKAGYPTGHFDIVTMINVLEHLRHPNRVLAEIARITRPENVVAVHVPNVHSLAARLKGATWHHYEPLEHFTYFNARTLRLFLAKHNFTVIRSFSLPGTSKLKKVLLAAMRPMHLYLDNGLGVLARRN